MASLNAIVHFFALLGLLSMGYTMLVWQRQRDSLRKLILSQGLGWRFCSPLDLLEHLATALGVELELDETGRRMPALRVNERQVNDFFRLHAKDIVKLKAVESEQPTVYIYFKGSFDLTNETNNPWQTAVEKALGCEVKFKQLEL